MMKRDEIEKRIPHRPPFLWIDRVEELEPGVRCVAGLLVDGTNPLFAGHFPARPILPGVLIIEAMAQTAAVMLGAEVPAEAAVGGLLAAVNRFKFFRPVLPGMQMRIETRMLTRAGRLACIEGTVSVDGLKVACGELMVAGHEMRVDR
ncbi:MAG: 3-hydroxyacyl-ACP dehydratase FabZ [Terracidiphilus sp.]